MVSCPFSCFKPGSCVAWTLSLEGIPLTLSWCQIWHAVISGIFVHNLNPMIVIKCQIWRPVISGIWSNLAFDWCQIWRPVISGIWLLFHIVPEKGCMGPSPNDGVGHKRAQCQRTKWTHSVVRINEDYRRTVDTVDSTKSKMQSSANVIKLKPYQSHHGSQWHNSIKRHCPH